MRRFLVLAVASLVLSGAQVSWAGGDKTAEAFVDPSSLGGGANGFTNILSTGGTSSGTTKSGSCLLQVQLKGLTGFADGAVLICIAEADVRAAALGGGANTFGNSVVLRASVKAGGAKLKADLKKVGCGSSDVIALNGFTSCYEPDADYSNVDDTAAGTNWEEACLGAGMAPVANPSVAPPAIDPGPVKDGLLGLCQGFAPNAGERIPRPATGLIAEQGSSSPAS
jgi:hypothetical protein